MNRKILYPMILFPIIIIIVIWWWFCFSMTTIIFVRHADRVEGVDALTPAGNDRAVELIHVAEKLGATAIYHSGANRTRSTVEPLATALGITMTEEPNVQLTIDDIFSNHLGETVVVAGHSNTVPQMIEIAGGPTLSNINPNEYDNLFVLTRCHCSFGPVKLLNLQYGAATP